MRPLHRNQHGNPKPIQAVLHPGLLECLLKEHKWPTGSDEDLEWLGQAMRLLRQLLMQHARRARD